MLSPSRGAVLRSTRGLLAVGAAFLLVGWSASVAAPTACTLITLADAQLVIGPPLGMTHDQTHPTGEGTFSTCVYSTPGASLMTPGKSVEIHYWLLSDPSAVQARFQRVLHPGQLGAGTTITPVSGLGDEADFKRTEPTLSSIEFRKGPAIVTIGTMPSVADSLLKNAANTAIGRL